MAQNSEFWIQLVVTSFVTLMAAYGGAKYAFSIQNRRDDSKQREDNVTNGNLALFTIIRYHNKLRNLSTQMIGTWRDHPHRHHFIKPSLVAELDPPSFDYTSLAFLIKSHPNLLGKIAVLEHDIAGTFATINERSRIHMTELQPVVEAIEKELAPDSPISIDEVEARLGGRSTALLVSSTDFMVRGIDRAIERTRELSSELGEAIKQEYPAAVIITIVDN